jgi:hypothetical protein
MEVPCDAETDQLHCTPPQPHCLKVIQQSHVTPSKSHNIQRLSSPYLGNPFFRLLSPRIATTNNRGSRETPQITNDRMSQNSSPTGTNSSISSSVRFDLDPHDTSKILVYTYRVGVKTSSQQQLCKSLDKGTSWS